ncbi:MAG: glycosyltransferase [Rickettsiales bacterium]
MRKRKSHYSITFDYSMNLNNPYCGISKDVNSMISMLKDRFLINKYNLSTTFKAGNFLPNAIDANSNSLNYTLNKIYSLLGFKLHLNPLDSKLFFCFSPNNYSLPNKVIKIIRLHDLIPITHPNLTPFFSTLLLKNNLRYNAREKNTLFICNSNQSKKELLFYYPNLSDRVFILPCHIEMQSPNILSQNYSLLIAALEPKKNIYNFLLGWRNYVLNNNSAYSLYIIGNKGWKNSKVSQLISSLKKLFPEKIKTLNKLSDSEVSHYISNCKYLVSPSIREGFGLPQVEAIMKKKSILTSNIGIFHETNKKCATTFNPFSVNDICEKIKIMESKENYKKSNKDIHTVANKIRQHTAITTKKFLEWIEQQSSG